MSHTRRLLKEVAEKTVLSFGLIVLLLILIYRNWLWDLDQIFYDIQVRNWIRQPSNEIVIIAIDERSLSMLGRWPWSRQNHANLVDILSEAGSAAIVFNILFSEPDLEAKWLELEITESALMRNEESTIKILQDLKTMGVGLAIDDFGTGYSSLNYLRQFPIDRLKIDRSFVQDIGDKPEGPAIVRAIIAMAHNMRLEVTAEGVETETQSRQLKSWQCDKLQGYYFSRPLGQDELTAMLEQSGSYSFVQPPA